MKDKSCPEGKVLTNCAVDGALMKNKNCPEGQVFIHYAIDCASGKTSNTWKDKFLHNKTPRRDKETKRRNIRVGGADLGHASC
ncbi:hypothetical protein TNCT_520501 [Trichonephila clavata]|uniref:Uncharacterized protein n=1 Tax=Trichonephila clavata TaxID=2740835 RepID=A0A8X6IFT6_TRICU|nr:hypothetical protein TNCT_520501 [Trichonephila clavata]